VTACLDRADAFDKNLKAFLHRCPDRALSVARRVDDLRAKGERPGALAGVPMGLKDLLVVEGMPTTCGSRLIEDFVPPYDAAAFEALSRSGAVLVGKCNLDEFGMGSSGEHSAFGASLNPWDPSRVPGGSSSGSAVAVAAGFATFAIGTDTGGSVRQPAAFCGLVGLKPSWGRLSRYGMVAYAPSMDCVGILAHELRDAALVLTELAGPDPRDATCRRERMPDVLGALEDGVADMRLGVAEDWMDAGLDAEMEQAISAALRRFSSAGARLRPVKLGLNAELLDAFALLAAVEAASNLARFDGLHYGRIRSGVGGMGALRQSARGEGFGPGVLRRIKLGTDALSAGTGRAGYERALAERARVRHVFEKVFAEVDAIIAPVCEGPAFGLGERLASPSEMIGSDRFTMQASLAGLPALSMPCGFSSSGLPLGLQIIARPFDEAGLLRVARALEARQDFHLRRPPLDDLFAGGGA